MTDMHNQLLNTLYNMCKIDRDRQLEAAEAGIIPHMQYFITTNSPLKQFALPIICDMAHCKPVPRSHPQARPELWRNDGINFYLALLKQSYWQVNALDGLSVWLTDERQQVEPVLVAGLEKIVDVFGSSTMSFDNLLDPLHKIAQTSPLLANKLAGSKFVPKLCEKLQHHNPLVRVTLLKILGSLWESAEPSNAKLLQKTCTPILENLKNDKQSILVRQLAVRLVGNFSQKR